MSIFRRMRDITVATFNDALEHSQDPVRMIDQFLFSTQRDIAEAEKLYGQYSAHTRQMKLQLDQALVMQNKREEQALLSLKAGEDHIARLALQEKMLYEEKIEQYSALWKQSMESLQELEYQLKELRTEYQTVYSKRQYYVARMETLNLQRQMNERAGTYGGRNLPRMFDRLENKVADIEAEAYSMRELRRSEAGYADRRLTENSVLERELEKLKQKLNIERKE